MSESLTVFTSTVYPDLARIWHACVRRAFPAGETRIEIFVDSEAEVESGLFPAADILRRAPHRREHHEAYRDAVLRAETPWLAIIDSDVFWVSPDLWSWVRGELARPEVAAVACMSRERRRSHATFAVVLKAAVYREVLAGLPAGFCKWVENPESPVEQWRYADTGDLLTEAVLAAGHEVRLLHLDRRGDLVAFDKITVFRRTLGLLGLERLARAQGGELFWRGYLGNLVLRRLHDRLFPEGPAYDFPYPAAELARQAWRGGARQIAWRLAYARRLLARGRRIERFAAGG